MKRLVTCLLMLCALAALAVPAHASPLLYSYFTGNGETGLHLAWSEDGLTWEALNNGEAVMAPGVGENEQLVRDPCIVQGPDGVYHMVWTPGWHERGIGYASSEDLITWSEQRFLPVMASIDGTRNSWAPEIFYDEAEARWLIFWASTVEGRVEFGENPEGRWNHRMYYTTTRDFESFDPPEILYDHGFSVIDSTIFAVGGAFAMILKDETRVPPEKNLRVAHADRPEGPWGPPSEPITGDYWAEGPTVARIGGRWHVYFDKYQLGRMGVVVSDDLETWEDWSERVSFPEGTRHGTVLPVERSAVEKLAESFDHAGAAGGWPETEEQAAALTGEAQGLLDEHPFRPPLWLRNGHLQTLFPPLARRQPSIAFTHERWDTPDDDFLDLYFVKGEPDAPMLVLQHGLGGSIESNYIVGIASRFVPHGWHIAVQETRATGPEINQARKLFHAAMTEDLDFVVRELAARHPERPIFVAGISLGGNIVGNWLGEQGDDLPPAVRGAAIVCPPFNPAVSSPHFEQAAWGRYSREFMKRLMPVAIAKEAQYPGSIDIEALKEATTLREFDDIVTAPLHGFGDVENYYSQVGCVHVLDRIRVPTLLIAAEDDPFYPPETIPREIVDESPWLVPQWTERGGHVGFVYGWNPLRPRKWDEEQIERFFLFLDDSKV